MQLPGGALQLPFTVQIVPPLQPVHWVPAAHVAGQIVGVTHAASCGG